MDNIQVLLAEDDFINQKVAILTLEKLGVVPDLADNGKIAVDMNAAKKYDVILMDIQMPVMDGITATKAIRKYETDNNVESKVRIYALTANVYDDREEEYLDAGMDGFISKPFRTEHLKKALGI